MRRVSPLRGGHGHVGQAAFCAGLTGQVSHTSGLRVRLVAVRMPAVSKVTCSSAHRVLCP